MQTQYYPTSRNDTSRRNCPPLTDQELDQKLIQTRRSSSASQDKYMLWLESTKVQSDEPWPEFKGKEATDWNSIGEELGYA